MVFDQLRSAVATLESDIENGPIVPMVTPAEKNGEVLSESSERLPALRYVCLMGMPPKGLLEQKEWRPTMFGEMVAGGSAVSEEALRERQESVKPSDPTLILYTSGTTGFPKGAMLPLQRDQRFVDGIISL